MLIKDKYINKMGNVNGTMEGEGDCKFMEQQRPGSCQYLKHWKRKKRFFVKIVCPSVLNSDEQIKRKR